MIISRIGGIVGWGAVRGAEIRGTMNIRPTMDGTQAGQPAKQQTGQSALQPRGIGSCRRDKNRRPELILPDIKRILLN
jgi:hypothetical protein